MYDISKIINKGIVPAIFRSSDITKIDKGASMRAIRYSLNSLLKTHKLLMVKKGVYSTSADPFFIAQNVFKGYIGFSSALYLLGLKNESEANVYVCIAENRKGIMLLGKNIVPVNMSRYFYGTKIVHRNESDILVSTLPKTLFDMFYRVKYGSFQDIYRALNNYSISDGEWKELLGYALSSNVTVARRVGYALESKAPPWFIADLLRKSDKPSGPSFFYEHTYENYNKKWNIFDSLNVKRWENGI